MNETWNSGGSLVPSLVVRVGLEKEQYNFLFRTGRGTAAAAVPLPVVFLKCFSPSSGGCEKISRGVTSVYPEKPFFPT